MASRLFRIRLERTQQFLARENNWILQSLILQTNKINAAFKSKKEAVELVVNTLHQYLGVTIGETLGFTTMGVWAILTAIALYQSGYLPKWAAYLSDLSGLGIIAGVLEWAGSSIAVEINAYAYQLWILLLAGLGVSFLMRRKESIP
ncbi:DUF4386 family protein [Paenibacillus sp. NEAU-GSW1]|uniref:DUF4386 family protein n=1 Tax=Paenibacillus sp. NEAU-GSW1 TaxID=2682486 RepID=UPI0020A66BA0|nr:DUF4386 family protein [Paenibacillus sp. NEAU-GSW1]